VSAKRPPNCLPGSVLLVLPALHALVVEVVPAVSSTVRKLLHPRLKILGADIINTIVVVGFAFGLELLPEELDLLHNRSS
jgi:hypothetical protein